MVHKNNPKGKAPSFRQASASADEDEEEEEPSSSLAIQTPQRFAQSATFSDIQLQQIAQLLRQLNLYETLLLLPHLLLLY